MDPKYQQVTIYPKHDEAPSWVGIATDEYRDGRVRIAAEVEGDVLKPLTDWWVNVAQVHGLDR